MGGSNLRDYFSSTGTPWFRRVFGDPLSNWFDFPSMDQVIYPSQQQAGLVLVDKGLCGILMLWYLCGNPGFTYT